MGRKRHGRWRTVSAILSLLLICLLAVLATAASNQDTTTITGNVVDNTPPAAVTNLAVTSPSYTSLTLTWTAPGNDGDVGTAAQYDIRYSTSTITNANWVSATQCSSEPTPKPAGSSETFTVTGLSSGTRYYFGIKTADEAPTPNWSDLSNIPSGITLGGGGGGPWPGPPSYYLKVNFMGKVTTIEVNEAGILQEAVTLVSPDGAWTLEIAKGTKVLTVDGKRATSIVAEEATGLTPPSGGTIIKAIDFTPAGITFSPPAILRGQFESTELPQSVSSVIIAYYTPERGWNELDTEWARTDHLVTVSAEIHHFTPFAAIYYLLAPPSFGISNLTISPSQAKPGQEITITATVTNSGGTAGDYTVELKINDVTEASKLLSLAPGASQTVGFTVKRFEAGSYQVDVNGFTGAFEVKEKPVTPVTPFVPTPPEPINWWLFVEVIAAVAVAMGLVYFFLIRRRYGGTVVSYPAALGKPVGVAIVGYFRFLLKKCKWKK